MKRDAQFTLRLPSELLATLRDLARAEDRSVSYYIERVLRQHVDQTIKASGKKR